MKQWLLFVFLAGLVLSGRPALADIQIAAAGPVTGPLASLGEQMLAGARQAVEDINARGGVLGQKLNLIIGDDQCDPKQAVALANRMASKGVAFVAGHICSDATIAASKVYEEERVIMITPTATNPKLTDEGGATIFRICGRDDQQGAVLGRYIAEVFAGKRVGVIHDKSAYGRGLAEATREEMAAAGLKAVLFEAYTAGEKDFAALVSRLKKARIDALFIGGYHGEAGLILRQMRDQGLAAQLIGADALVLDEYWSITGEAGEGTLFSFAPDMRKNMDAAALVARYRARGAEPSGYVLYTYAAIQAWAQAVERAGKIDGPAVAAALRAKPLETVIGRFRFNANGDVDLPPYSIYRWGKGEDGAGRFEELAGPQ
jgi:branched-chain amino acid transport system substrate-binding protein